MASFLSIPGDGQSGKNSLQLSKCPTLNVVRADGLPHLRTLFGAERKFYVTATDGVKTAKTSAIRSREGSVQWDEVLSGFAVNPSSRLIVRIFAHRTRNESVLMGTVAIPFESLYSFSLNAFDIPVESTQRTTLVLSISLSDAPQRATVAAVSSSKVPEASTRAASMPLRAFGSNVLLGDEPVDQNQASAEALRGAEEAMANIKTFQGSPLDFMEAANEVPDNLERIVDFYDTWNVTLKNVQWIVGVVDKIAEIHPWAKMAWSILSCIPKAFIAQVERDDTFKALLVAIRDVFDLAELATGLKNLRPRSIQAAILTRMLHHVCECGDLIQNYAKNGDFWKRLIKSTGGRTEQKVKSYSDILTKLRQDFLYHGIVTTEMTVLEIPARLDGLSGQLERVASGVTDVGMIVKIGEIPYPEGARFRTDKGCLPRTRVAFLDYIADWVNSPGSSRALVLFGQAGTGKSSIANEIAHRFHQTHRLTSSFVFSRTERTGRYNHLLLTGLVRDLADRYPAFRTSLGKTIENDTSLRSGVRDYATIFESMLLKSLKDVPLIGPVFVVIDALDESGDASGRTGLHTLLANRISELPSNFRILITSRPEKDIVDAFQRASSLSAEVRQMDDPILSSRTVDDIHAYIRHQLPDDLFELYGAKLAGKAEQSFQWAAVACDYIQYPPPGHTSLQRVDQLLALPSGNQAAVDPLDSLYKTVLSVYFDNEDVLPLFQSVVGQLLAAFEPLSIRSLAALRQYNDPPDLSEDSIQAVVGHLGSLLSNVTLPNSSLPIVPLHTSFRDFLTDHKRAGKFWINLKDAHHQLAHCSFGLMHHRLGLNICRLRTSHQWNSDISDLQSRISKYISDALSYACRYWDDHLVHVALSELVDKVQSFFEEDFLFWLESLSLLGFINLAPKALSIVNTWQAKYRDIHPHPVELDTLTMWTSDASKFVGYFGTPISQSAPHIYLSALPFSPEASIISKHYAKSFPNTLLIEHGRASDWQAQEMAIPVDNSCESVAFSPGGSRIASGCASGSIHVWDAKTGQAVSRPFTGNTRSVWSVAFSPDGQRIASGSRDGTIRVWDAETGRALTGPFTGHTDQVTSVAFSPDGRCITSGSGDRTVRVWGAKTGRAVASPFAGHGDWVRSVAFSPDGQLIASGSDDRTIRVWDARTGRMAAGPFMGHTAWVRSVAFSPDGQSIVSGSHDCTVRTWDAKTGHALVGPFTGHTDWVRSVAFSPDGLSIASGSNDHTIRVWDAKTGQATSGRLTGHMEQVNTVTFSPDGHRIASGSGDRTIRVWDVKTGQAAAAPLTEHTGWVRSVTFSSNGQLVASGSSDCTVLVWDAKTGRAVSGPFVGHTNQITSVAFSPDCRLIASGSDDHTIRVWVANTGEAATVLTGHTDVVSSIAFSPDGRHIASGSNDRTIRVWDAKTGHAIVGRPFAGHTDWIFSVVFSPDGRFIASGSDDGTVRIWDFKTGRATAGPFREHTGSVMSVAFSPDGQYVASGSKDHTVRIRNTRTGQTIAGPFTAHTDWIRSVAFSPDGQHIASGSDDCTICVWESKTGEMVAGPFRGHANAVWSVAFSPDGRSLVSGSQDKAIRLWTFQIPGAAEQAFPHPRTPQTLLRVPDQERLPDRSSSLVHPPAHGDASLASVGTPSFMDGSTIDENGWVRGADGELLMWIPEPHRSGLHRPSNVWVASSNEIRLNTTRFVHGLDWTMCYVGDAQTRTDM